MDNDFRILIGVTANESEIKEKIANTLSRVDNTLSLTVKLDEAKAKSNISNTIKKIENNSDILVALKTALNQQKLNQEVKKAQKAFDDIKFEITPEDTEEAVKSAKEQLKYYEKIKEEVKTITELEKQLAELNTKQSMGTASSNSATEAELKRQLKNANARKSYNEGQLNSRNLRDSNLDAEVDNLVASLNKKLSLNLAQLIDKEVFSSDKAVANIKTKLDTNTIDKQISDIEKRFAKLGDLNGNELAQTNLTNQIAEIKELKANLTQALNSGNNEAVVEIFNKLDTSIKTCNNDLKIQSDLLMFFESSVDSLDRKTFVNNIDAWLKNNTAAGEELRAKLEHIRDQAMSCDAVDFSNLKKEFKEVKSYAEATGQTGRSLFDELKNNAKKFTQWFSISQVVMEGVQQAKKMVSSVYEVDTAMTSLYKVTDETDARYQKFLTNSITNAKELGRSVSSLVEQSAEWAKLGYSLSDSEKLAQVSSVYANVGELDDSTAISDMVTVMKAYNLNSNSAIDIVDKLNELGNNYATESAALGEGINNMASTMAMANVSLDKSLAILTGGTEITQNAGELGNAIKVAVLRMRGQKGDLEELGEEYEDVEAVSKIQTQILNLTKGAVNIMESADPTSFRDYYDVMKDIADILPTLTETDQASLIEILFGKVRANQGQAILQAFQSGQIQAALETAQNASGSAEEEQERWLNSMEGKIGQFEASFQSLSNTIFDSDLLKFFIDFGNGAISVLDKVIDKLGIIPPLISAIAVFKGKDIVNSLGALSQQTSQVKTGVSGAAGIVSQNWNNTQGVKGKVGSVITGSLFQNTEENLTLSKISNSDIEAMKAFNKALDNNVDRATAWSKTMVTASEAAQEYATINGDGKIAVEELAQAQKTAKATTVALTAAEAAKNAVISMGISLLITAAVSGISYLINYDENLAEAAETATANLKEMNDEIQSQNSTMNSIAGEYADLSKGVNSLGDNVSLTSDEYSRYHEITNQIADMFPTLVQGYDDEGNAILKTKGDLEELTAAYKDAQKEQAKQSYLENSPDIVKNAKNAFSEDSISSINWWGISAFSPYGSTEASLQRQKEALEELKESASDFETFKKEYSKYSNPYVYNSLDPNRNLASLIGNNIGAGFQLNEDTFSDYVDNIEEQLTKVNAQLDPVLSGLKESLEGALYFTPDYDKLDSTCQKYVSTLINSLNAGMASDIINNSSVEEWTGNLVRNIANNDEFRNALNEVFSLQDVDISVDEMAEKLDSAMEILSKELNTDKGELEVQLGFENIDELEEKYYNVIEQTKELFEDENFDPTSFFEENSVNTTDELDQWIEITRECQNAAEAVEKYSEWKTEAASKELVWDDTASENWNTYIDNLQSAYSTLQSAAEEYNEYGAYSLDTLQSLLSLEPQYLNMLVNENGQISLNQTAMQGMVQSKVLEAKARVTNTYAAQLDELATANSAVAAEQAAKKHQDAAAGIDTETEAYVKNANAAWEAALAKAQNNEFAQPYIEQIQANRDASLAVIDSVFNSLNNNFSGAMSGYSNVGDSAQNASQKAQDAQDKYNETLEDTNEKLEELDEKEHLQNLKNQIDECSLAIEKFDDDLDLLDLKLDILDEDDYADRADVIAQKLELVTQKGSALKSEFEQLSNTTPQTADEADEIASRMETIGDSLRSNLKDWVSYTKELEEIRVDAIIDDAMGDIELPDISGLRDSFESEITAIEHNIKAIKGETLFGDVQLFSNIMPLAPKKSEAEEQADEEKRVHEEQLEELEAYEEQVFEVKQNALLMQQQANQEAIDEERQELLDSLEEAKQELEDSLSEAASNIVSTVSGISNSVIPANQNTANSFDGVGNSAENAANKVSKFSEALKQAQDVKYNTITSNDLFTGKFNTILSNDLFVSQKASGGTVGRDEIATLVNEKGQESAIFNGKFMLLGDGSPQLINLPVGTKVIPAEETAEILKYTGDGIDNISIPHLEEGNVGDVSVDVMAQGSSLADNTVYLQLKLQELEYLRQLSELLVYVNSFVKSEATAMPISHGESGKKDTEREQASADFPDISGKISEFISNTSSAIEGGLNAENISLDGLTDKISKALTDNKFSTDLSDEMESEVDDVLSDVEKDVTKSNDDVNILESLLGDEQDDDKLIDEKLKEWEKLPQEMQDSLSNMDIDADAWNELISEPDGELQAMQLLEDGSDLSWDNLSPTVQTILLNMGVEGKEEWDAFVEASPLQAFSLYVETWDLTKSSMQQYMTDMVNIVINGATTIAATQIPAPQISNESWNNLQSLIAQRIEGILNTINATFNENAVDLNFNVNFEMGTAQNNVVGGSTSGAGMGNGNVPLFIQGDYQQPYGDRGTIATSGCGPTSMAMVLSALTGQNIDPVTAAEWSASHGYRVSEGTSWGFFAAMASQYGITTQETGVSADSLVGTLKSGKLMIASMMPGDFTKAGHFIVLTGVTSDGKITVNDPNSVEKSQQAWDADRISSQTKAAWAFSYARGTKYHPGGSAVVGDGNKLRGISGAAPELIFHQNGTVDLAGINGAEIRELERGDVVLNAYDTRRMLRGNGNDGTAIDGSPSYATGTTDALQVARNMFTSRASSKENTQQTDTGSTVSGGGNFPKYSLTQDQIDEIATVAYGEQGGNTEAIYAEVSQMANLSEVSHGHPATGEALLQTLHSGWYAKSSWGRGKSDVAVQAVHDVLINGYRTLPKYVVEHDYIGDIAYVSPGEKNDRSTWIPHVTVIHQGSGVGAGQYIYYSTPGGTGDPFGYFAGTREKYGDDCYTISGVLQSSAAFTKAFNATLEALKNLMGVTSTNTHTTKKGVVSKFAKGGVTGNNLSLVSEDAPEIISLPNGDVGLVEKPTLAKLPKGTEVVNGKDTADILKYLDPKRQRIQKFASGTVDINDPADRVIQAIIAQILKDGIPDEWDESENEALKDAKAAYDWATKQFEGLQSNDDFKEYKDWKIEDWFDSKNELTNTYYEETEEYRSKITDDAEALARFDEFVNQAAWYNSEIQNDIQAIKDALTQSGDNIVEFLEATDTTMSDYVKKVKEQAALSDSESFELYSDYLREYNDRKSVLSELVNKFLESPEDYLSAKQLHQAQMNEGATAIREDEKFLSLLEQVGYTVEDSENWYNATGEFSEKYLSDLEAIQGILSDEDFASFQYYTESISWYKKEWSNTEKDLTEMLDSLSDPELYAQKQADFFSDIVKTAQQNYKDNILSLYNTEKAQILKEAETAKEIYSQAQDAWNIAYDLYQTSLTDGSSYETQQKYYENLQDCNDALSEAQDWMNSLDDSWQDMIDGVVDFYEEIAEYTSNKYVIELDVNERELEYLERFYSHQQRLATQNIVLGERQAALLKRNEYIAKTKDELHGSADDIRSEYQDVYDFFTARGINLEDLWDSEGNLSNLYYDLQRILGQENPEMWARIAQLAQSMVPYKEQWMELDEEQLSNQEEIFENEQDIWRNGLDIVLEIAENILNVHDNIITSLQKENDLLNRQLNRTSKYTEQQEISEAIIANDKEQLQAYVNRDAEITQSLQDLYSNPQYQHLFDTFDVSKWVDENGEQTGYYLTDINSLKDIGSTEDYNDAVALFELLSYWVSQSSETATNIEDTIDKIQADTDSYYQQQVDAANTAVEKVISMIEARKERELKALDQVHEKRVEQLQEEAELVQDIYNRATNLLDDVKAEEDYEEELADEQKRADNLQAQIDQYALDDSDASVQKRIELQKELNEQLEKIEDLKRDHEYEQTKEALSDDLELYNDYMDELQDAEDKQYQYNQELIEARYTQDAMYAEAYQVLQDGIFEDFTAKGVYSYEQLYDKGNQVALDLTTAYKNFATETGERFSNLGAEFENMIGLFEKYPIISAILTSGDISEWNIDANAPYSDSTGINWYGETNLSANSNLGSTALTNSSGFTADETAIIAQMATNSKLWQTASPTRQEALHAQNEVLAAQIGAVYNDADGHYYKNGQQLYHSGKVSKEAQSAYKVIDETLNPDEELATILKSESVITTDKMYEWAKGISLLAGSVSSLIPTSVVSGLHNLDKALSTITTNYNDTSDNSVNVDTISIGAGNNITKSDVRDGLQELSSALKTYR